MNISEAQAQIAAATDSAKQQIDLSKNYLSNLQDAADLVTLRRSADAVVDLAKVMALTKPDPTT